MRPLNAPKLTNLRGRLVIVIGLLMLLSISCSLPISLPFLSGGVSAALEQDLINAGLADVSLVEIEKEGVFITYQISPDDSLEVLVSTWGEALNAAGRRMPGADTYILHLTRDGAPFLDVKAEWPDLNEYIKEDLSLEELLDRLEVNDRRPLEALIEAALAPLSLDQPEVILEAAHLRVSYQANPVLGPDDLIQTWWEIFAVLGQYDLPVDSLQIQAVMGDGSIFLAEVTPQSLNAYLAGELSAVEFLAGMQISDDLAP